MSSIQTNDKIRGVVETLKIVRREIKYFKKAEEKLTQELYNYMTENEELISEDGVPMLSWKYAADSYRFDSKRFESEQPGLYSEYLKVQPGSRRLLFKEENEKN